MKELCAVAEKLATPNAVFIGACLDSLNLERPAQIRKNKSTWTKAAVRLGKIELLKKRQWHAGKRSPLRRGVSSS